MTVPDELFMTDALRQEDKLSCIRNILPNQIDDMLNHPYKVRIVED